ncbi:hypothetical protein E9531_07215 [Lampropedia puyangensis]|uniref:Glycosyltransferase family 39 protein n=1 Tax=Lampropedia puyangensis TaxID=1330072 RepID=A0A4S8F9C9_9BURK|nr:hypothetical protein [Lampropedia puyangensis]THU02874.1 hypothetical protein E9531_07215 [Lampropedia puyangensis]
MNTKLPTPAIVTQAAVRTLPRLWLWLLCLVYTCAGFIGRHPWKNEDMATYGYIQALAQGHTDWFTPELVGLSLEPANHVLPIWLGAVALKIAPSWIDPQLVARLPFMGMVLLSFAAVWWATFYLARRDEAQPVAFAFGGEADPQGYARAIADGSVLALIACFGLVQFSHEVSATLVQLFGASLLFLGFAQPTNHILRGCLITVVAAFVLLTSGGLAWGGLAGGATLVGLLVLALLRRTPNTRAIGAYVVTGTVVALLAKLWLPNFFQVEQYRWELSTLSQWTSFLKLLIWFGWPAWPLACWALYRWRAHLFNRAPSFHLALPLGLIAMTVLLAACSTGSARDRTLFLSLPMAATMAAFALPTMRRSVSSLIDWFTMLFFTICGIAIWVIWTATQTGFPAKPAANVAKLAPEYVPTFSAVDLSLAVAATVIWLSVVVWRTGRHQAALWKSLVLPAGGATWCVVLVMTLWLPMLDYGRSFAPQIEKMAPYIPKQTQCIWAYGLNAAQRAAFAVQAQWPLQAPTANVACPQSMVAAHQVRHYEPHLLAQGWRRIARIERPTSDEAIVLYAFGDSTNGGQALPPLRLSRTDSNHTRY